MRLENKNGVFDAKLEPNKQNTQTGFGESMMIDHRRVSNFPKGN
jgi:hypothetical protein